MLPKVSSAGIQVKTAVDEANEMPLLSLAEGTKLSFFLTLQNPCFSSFTALNEPKKGHIYVFSNNADQETLSHSEILISDVVVDQTTFALVEIQVTNGLLATLEQEKKFIIQFNAVGSFWKYYLVTPTSSNDYTISNVSTNDTAAINFQKVLIDSPLALQDKVAEALLEEFPNQKTYRFTSTTEVAFQAMGRKNIQLKRGNNTLIQHLPNPSSGDQGIKILKL